MSSQLQHRERPRGGLSGLVAAEIIPAGTYRLQSTIQDRLLTTIQDDSEN